MDSNELVNILQTADNKVVDKFMDKNNSNLKITENIERNQFDYTWLSKIEETIEALDQIVRNPRKFILQEEEIVPIEKAKKISQESIKHLATHTNLIQDVDKDGTITPIAVLNIHKEESFDIYENRFVKSLLFNLKTFMRMRKMQTASGSSSKVERKMQYNGETKVGNENIKISLNLESLSLDDLIERSPLGLSLGDRIIRIEEILSDFDKSPFIRELANALPVKSPIRKTNVILKNQNFKKALELWEFIERYEIKDILEADGEHEIENIDNIVSKMDMAFFLDYAILNSLSGDKKNIRQGVNKYYLKKIIEDFVNDNKDVDEKAFKKLINEEFKAAKQVQIKIDKEIMKLVKNSIKKYQKNKMDSIKILK